MLTAQLSEFVNLIRVPLPNPADTKGYTGLFNTSESQYRSREVSEARYKLLSRTQQYNITIICA